MKAHKVKNAKKAMNVKTAKKAAKPVPPAVPVGPPPPLVGPLHTGRVNLVALPVYAWPAPSPAELATVAAACGWVNQTNGPARAMELLWECAEVIRESRQSAGHFVESIKLKDEWTASELRKACGFDYQGLPDKITHRKFLSLFNKSPLKVGPKTQAIRGDDLFNHWLALPDGGNVPLAEVSAWHARHKAEGFECTRYTMNFRWEWLALMAVRFREWRENMARHNVAKPGKKNLKQYRKPS